MQTWYCCTICSHCHFSSSFCLIRETYLPSVPLSISKKQSSVSHWFFSSFGDVPFVLLVWRVPVFMVGCWGSFISSTMTGGLPNWLVIGLFVLSLVREASLLKSINYSKAAHWCILDWIKILKWIFAAWSSQSLRNIIWCEEDWFLFSFAVACMWGKTLFYSVMRTSTSVFIL